MGLSEFHNGIDRSVLNSRVDVEEFRPALQKLLLFGGDLTDKLLVQPHIQRLRPPVKAHGGKYYLARQIVPILLGVRERITEYLSSPAKIIKQQFVENCGAFCERGHRGRTESSCDLDGW